MFIFATMNNAYHRDIMEILLSCGKEGMKLCRIASKVYNKHASLFDRDLDYVSLHRSLGMYLWRQSRHRESPFRRNAYGVYSIKPDVAVQLDLFWNLEVSDIDEEPEKIENTNTSIRQLEFWP